MAKASVLGPTFGTSRLRLITEFKPWTELIASARHMRGRDCDTLTSIEASSFSFVL